MMMLSTNWKQQLKQNYADWCGDHVDNLDPMTAEQALDDMDADPMVFVPWGSFDAAALAQTI